jgi:hypothetical protein
VARNLPLISPPGNEEDWVRTRKVVTEITIETNQILVIKRKQVTRSRSSECASEAEFVGADLARPNFVRPNRGNVLVDETWNRQVVEAPATASLSSETPDGSHALYRRSLLSATMLAKRFLSRLSRGSKPESETSRLKGQKSKSANQA